MQYIAFHGVPRSGTSWVGAIFDSSENVTYRHQPLFSYAFKSFLNEHSSTDRINLFFENLKNSNDSFILQEEGKIKRTIPIFTKKTITHLVYKEARYHHILENMLHQNNKIKVVVIVRNPKSVISSWFHAPKEFNKDKWSLKDEWLYADKKNKGRKEEFYGYEKWKEAALLFLKLKKIFPKRVYILKYSDLLSDTENQVKQLFDFCSINYGDQTAQFLKLSKSIDKSYDAYSVYRTNQSDDKWIVALPKEIIDYIDIDLLESELNIFNHY
jgi:hypothetical protein